MQVKPNIDCTGAAIVTLAGKEWFVPVLALRQNRIAIPALLRVLPFVTAARDPNSGAFFDLFTDENIGLLHTIIHAALTRAYDLPFDAFLDMPVTPQEMVGCIAAITKQTAFFDRPDDGSNKAKPSGEADAAGQ